MIFKKKIWTVDRAVGLISYRNAATELDEDEGQGPQGKPAQGF